MKAKAKTKVKSLPRVSAKQKLVDYKQKVYAYIQLLRNPSSTSAFSVTGYSVVAGVKRPNTISVPELLAIVGTAGQLGKQVHVSVSGREDGGQVNFIYVDQVAPVPAELF